MKASVAVPERLQPHADAWLRNALGLADGDAPFPWQEELFNRLLRGTIDRALDIPTGLGKTAVMALWLIARACGANLPRRLVYVVDRRAVVDQATEIARHLRRCVDDDPRLKEALQLPGDHLPISTLRGQHMDNREWLGNPASPAIIVGTVDMIGSRLLFEGYGTSRKMRPYHAGLIGADTLLILDEAHLVPPFEKLVEAVAKGSEAFGPRDPSLAALVPPLRVMSLSATGRAGQHKPFGLTDADLRPGTVTKKRLDAPKRLSMLAISDAKRLPKALAEHAWALSDQGARPVRCIVFTNSRRDAEATQTEIAKLAKGSRKDKSASARVVPELLVGGRRVLEREEAARHLMENGYLAGTKVELTRPAFLIATSAGEVGVDLDADHMVCDLVEWERMVQRLGRVNRRGDGNATVIVVRTPRPTPSAKVQTALDKAPEQRSRKEAEAAAKFEARVERWAALARPLEHLPVLDDGSRDASPGAIRELKIGAGNALLAMLEAASSRPPLRPPLSRALVDAWSMTSLAEHPGRPEVGPWLRGWTDDPAQTAIVWRTYLPISADRFPATKREIGAIEAFFEAAPPHPSERLEMETTRDILPWLVARAEALVESAGRRDRSPGGEGVDGDDSHRAAESSLVPEGAVAIALSSAGDVRRAWRLNDLVCHNAKARKRHERELHSALAGATLVVNAGLGGLTADGLLSDKAASRPRTVDDGGAWMRADGEPVVRFRVRRVGADEMTEETAAAGSRNWRERRRFPLDLSNNGDVREWLVVDKWRHDAATEDDRSSGPPQLLAQHEEWTEARARELGTRLALPPPYHAMLEIAARLHDEGKKARVWQRAFNAHRDGVYAKTQGPVNVALLDGYRHEFGSLPVAANHPRLRELPEELRDLALHLIAAHHGFARPVINTRGCEDAPPSALAQRAQEVALRFARLQKRWGPWGLAWWEALLRAADQQASRDNELAGVSQAGQD